MTHRHLYGRIPLLAALLIAILNSVSSRMFVSSASAAVLSVEPAGNIDERLFLTYVLDDLYSAFPTDLSNAQQVQNDLSELRSRAVYYLEYVKGRNFDPRLTSLYVDLVAAIDHYEDFLESVGRIQRDAAHQIDNGRAKTSFDAGFTGGQVAAGEYDNGASGGDAALAGLVTAGLRWLLEDANQQQQITDATRDSLNAAARELKDELSSITARLDVQELDMAREYGWGKGEVRSSDMSEDMAAWPELLAANDIQGMLSLLDRKAAVRPRDPTLLALREIVSSCDPSLSAAAMRSLAQSCAAHAALVPKGAIYDSNRATILWFAGDIADRAFAKECEGRAWASAHSQIAAYSVDLWDTLLHFEPSDPTGECRERRAWALMASGRINEAVEQASKIRALRANTIRAALNMARLADAVGDVELSYKWFEHAVKELHFNAIAMARNDPDLDAMRQAKAAAFEDLVKVKCTWQIEYGFFNDDIVLINSSAFPITHVVLSCDVSANGKRWAPVLNADVIQPGQSFRWENCISIPGSRADSSSATVACDQNR